MSYNYHRMIFKLARVATTYSTEQINVTQDANLNSKLISATYYL